VARRGDLGADPGAERHDRRHRGQRPASRHARRPDQGCDQRGIVWYTNYESRKGQELAGNPYAALQFHWVELERVVRIAGRVGKPRAEESDAYYASRPLDSRIGAWASPQSQVIAGRSVLVTNAARYGAQYLLDPPRPPHWGGFRLVPDRWEF
jgi:pyridoxamine 5'-phosphate oxidase